ncbi:trypsin 3A1-like [Armigeres subalbatus]|uniref:trypsin 3A1-like n=1 Tax=Armigeres subalbatus TaxID=124917 RepID=UPI002ED43B1F
MTILTVVSFILLLNCIKWTIASTDSRIIGGYETKIEDVPYTVSLIMKNYGHFCGGTIVSRIYIVTAAHCVYDKIPADITVRAGSTFKNKGGKIREVKKIIIHPKYGKDVSLDFDIALLELKKYLGKTDFIDSIPIAHHLEMLFKRQSKCIVSGWGKTRKNDSRFQPLKSAKVRIVDEIQCQKALTRKTITFNMVCAGGDKDDACQGDSGGPMVCNGKLVGVVSFGEGCGTLGKPGVYAYVPQMWEWLTGYIGDGNWVDIE